MNQFLPKVESALKNLIDPEAGINVVDLGLLYEVNMDENSNTLSVVMIPTTAGCPLLHALSEGAQQLLANEFPGVEIDVQWRLDVEWNPDRIRQD